MQGAAGVSAAATGGGATDKNETARFSLGEICRFTVNSALTLLSNHRLPHSWPDALRQALSNCKTYLDTHIAAHPQGMATPPLAMASMLIEWLFWQQQHQATRQLLALTQVTSDNEALNRYFYRLNFLAHDVPAARALQRIKRYIASREQWRNSLTAEERLQTHRFEQLLITCLEKRQFWHPQPTLLQLPMQWTAPWLGVYLQDRLLSLGQTPSRPAPGQMIAASPHFSDGDAEDEQHFFDQGKHIIYVPGLISRPTLELSPRQEYCVKLPLCATDLTGALANHTAGYEIEGRASTTNEEIYLCILNIAHRPLFVNRELNTIRTPFPSWVYRNPLQLPGSSVPDIGVCPVPTVDTPVADPAPLSFLPQPDFVQNKLRNTDRGGFFPVAFAQDMAYYDEAEEPFIDEDNFLQFGGLPLLSPQEVPAGWAFEAGSKEVTTENILQAQAELINYEVNLATFGRDKRILMLERNPFMRRMATTPRTTLAPPHTTPDPLSRLFGESQGTTIPDSCRSLPPPLVARDLDVMMDQALQWLRYLPPALIDDKIHSYFLTLEGIAPTPLTPLEEAVTVIRKLVTGIESQYAFDEFATFDFTALVFQGSRFAESKELITAWLRSPAGKARLAEMLLHAIDRALPDAGILLSGTLQWLTQQIKPDVMRFSDLPNLKVELQNRFKSNLVASVYYARGTQPDFIRQHAVINKLQFLYLEWIKDKFPCFHLCNKPDVENDLVLSTVGVLSTIGAGMIANDEKLHDFPARKLQRFGKQAMLRLSDDFLLGQFAWVDQLLEKTGVGLIDYLNHFEEEGELRVQALYLNLRIAHQLNHGGEQSQQLKTDYQTLADVEKRLCTLALGEITPADQAIFLVAARQPQGLEVRFISAENRAARDNPHHFIGVTLTANHENTRRCNTLSVIPRLNDVFAEMVSDDSAHCRQANDYRQWINHGGKTALLHNLTGQSNLPLSDVTFSVSDRKRIPVASSTETWPQYAQRLSQAIIDQRFTTHASSTSTPSTPGIIGEMTNMAWNLLASFIPVKTCQQAFDAVRNRPDTVKQGLITTEYVALCAYHIQPESEVSTLVDDVGYAISSVAEKITDYFSEKKTQRAAVLTNANSPDTAQLREQLWLEDSQVAGRLAVSPPFRDYLRWMMRDKSLKLRPIPAGITIQDVRWNVVTDQLYCRANTPHGVKNYRVDEQNGLLLPSQHQFTDGFYYSQELVVDANAFIEHAESGTLDSLKTDRLEQDMRETNRYGDVLFKNVINEIDLRKDNIREQFFSHLNIYSPWQPVGLWVKKEVDDFIIIAFKDDKNKIHFKQLCNRDDVLIDWYGDPTRNRRVTRDATTPAPDYINMLTPLLYNYQEINQYNDAKRSADMMAIIYQGSQIPNLTHSKERRCRTMVADLIKLTAFSFIKSKFPIAASFAEKFAHWEIPIRINDGFNQFVDAIKQFQHEHHLETAFTLAATSIIKEIEEIDTKNKLINENTKKLKKLAKEYYENHIKSSLILNSRFNKAKDKLKNPAVPNAPQFILKTKSRNELMKKYPDDYAEITSTISKVHDIATVVERLLNSSHAFSAVKEVYQSFTGNQFTNRQVNTLIADYLHYVNELKSINIDQIRIFEERYTGDGRLAYNCLKTGVERSLYGSGNSAFILSGDKKKFIYLQSSVSSGANLINLGHEGRHLANDHNVIFTPAEFYADTDNPIVKFSLSGITHFGNDLLSNRYQLVDYLMRNREFLRNFCRQVNIFMSDSPLKRKVILFTNKFLGSNAWLYADSYGTAAVDKRQALYSVVEDVFKNNALVEYIIAHNADFSVAVLERLLEKANQYLESNQKVEEDTVAVNEQVKSLILQAGSYSANVTAPRDATFQDAGRTRW